MILPKVQDPRSVTIRRGGTLSEADHRLLALWAASCAEHVLDLFESAQPRDLLPEAIRELVLDDQRLRNEICWSVFDC
jgi:immunity protein 5 of polymorphic toxin system